MLGTYTYHQIIRKTVIAFGTLFNNIEIRKFDKDSNVESIKKVPISYGPRQKFLARLEQNPELNKKFEIGVPRMSFEMTGISYDPSRKVSPVQYFKNPVPNSQVVKTQYMPVPYNIEFELNIFSKINEDILQVVEQILPYFQPSFNVTINVIPEMDEKKDIPIILNNISLNDDYEGSYETRRSLIYTLNFTAKVYLYGPVTTPSVIKDVSVEFYADTDKAVATRVRQYNAVIDPPNATPDNFGFLENILEP